MKTCPKCKETLPLSAFTLNKAKKDGLNYSCRKCMNAYLKSHYRANIGYYAAKTTRAKAADRSWFNAIKSSLACANCGFSHPAALDFHHTDPSTKMGGGVNNLAKCGNRNAILDEIKKCTVLCANCHRIFHYDQRTPRETAIDE